MSHTVSGELRKPTYINQAGTMYAIELSEMNKDKEGNKTYTNYKASFFPKSQAAIDYYNQCLVEGAFVVVTCDKLSVEVSQCGKYTRLNMNFAKLDGCSSNSQPAQQQAPQQRQAQQQQPQVNQQQPKPQAPQPAVSGFDNFDDDIPFN